MIPVLFICNIINQTISCQNPIQVFPEVNFEEVLLTALITGGAVVGGIFLTHFVTTEMIKRRNSRAIFSDVHTVIQALVTFETRNYRSYDGWDICYVSQRFPLTTYQSITNSGELTHLTGKQQDLLIAFLHFMETRNRLLQEIEEIYRIIDIQPVKNWRNVKESAELKEFTITNMEIQLFNDLLPMLVSFFGGRRLDHRFFAEETS